MGKLTKLKQLIGRFRNDESGSIATMFGVSALTLTVAVGTTFDIGQVQSSASRAQQVADIVGLTATVYVKNHGIPPKNDKEGFMHGKSYSAKEMGFDMGPATNGSGDVNFTVYYDDKKGEAVVKLTGKIQTSFMGIAGQKYLGFESEATVKYSESDNGDPASIFLVLDNSGSMAWSDKQITGQEREQVSYNCGGWRRPRTCYYYTYVYKTPPGTRARIDGLKSEVKKFNDYLTETVEEKTKGKANEFLRMGMSVYASGLLSYRTVQPKWGTLTSNEINRLGASGGTYPDGAMRQTENWIGPEDAIHKNKNGSDKPLKYVIFMTDGVNSSSTTETRTLQSCTRMKNAGVKIYTIGFALEPGDYTGYTNRQRARLSNYNSAKAYNFLRQSASSNDHFVKAENTAALNDAFDKIGADIISDVIRVAS